MNGGKVSLSVMAEAEKLKGKEMMDTEEDDRAT